MRALYRQSLRVAYISLAMLLNGCALVSPHVEPFSFESVGIVFPNREVRFTPLKRNQQERYKGEFLVIRVQSKTNLAELAEEQQYNLWVKAWFCDEAKAFSLGTTGELRYQDAEVGYYSALNERVHVRGLLQQVPADAPKRYHFYMDISSSIKTATRDICAVIGGGGYVAKGFMSNVIVVPKEEIRSAFQAAEQ